MPYPDENALTQRATLKALLDPPIEGTESDALLDGLIQRVSNVLVEDPGLANLVIPNATGIVETRNGNGSASIVLRRWPAQSVVSVKVGGTTIAQATSATTSGWIFDATLNTVHLRGFVFSVGIQNVEISYTAGLASSHRILGALEQAALVTAASWWKRRSRVDLAATSSSGIQTESFSQRNIPAEARLILDEVGRHQPWIF